jgi:DNA polymerase-3 subunit alpha
MGSPEFVHLHLHSQYSLLDGAIKIPDLIAKIKEYKMPAVAMTDHGVLFGAMEFYSSVQASGLKPIVGCEVYVTPGSRHDKGGRNGDSRSNHLILLCENLKGYKNLCKLVTLGFQEGFYYKPRVDREILQKYNEGLICLSACLKGEVADKIIRGDEAGAFEAASWHREIFDSGRYFLELQENGIEEQTKVNEKLIEFSRRLDVGIVATNDCHYLDQRDHRAHEILLCIQTGKKLEDINRMSFSSEQFYVKSPEIMAYDFRNHPVAIKNTLEIAERCGLLLEFGQVHMPRFNLGTGETLRERFERDTRAGFEQRVGKLVQLGELSERKLGEYKTRLSNEIKMIQDMGFSGYFLIVADFINYAKGHDIPVGPGRGSAAGSLAAYSLGITDIDPIKYNLLFERFLNPERKSMPDIDVDFCTEGRDKVIEYVSNKYGKDHVAQIITFGRMQAKAVVRDVARVLGFPYSEADQIAKLIPDALKMTLDKAIKDEARLKEMMENSSEVKDLILTAKSLEGITRHASTHAAGVVISDKPLVESLPLYRGQNDETLTQFDMTWVEKIGLVKFDFLGLKTLTVLDRAIKLICESQDPEFDINAIPFDDAQTFEMLSKGDTLAVFQLESSGMREVLTKFKPSVFEDLIAILALYRPGPLESGMVDDFINRKHGRTQIEYPLEQLESILKETYGVIVYQEQVMSIAKELADYSLGEADLLRRAMGKKKASEMAEQKTRFEKGAAKNKIDPEKAAYIFDLMEKFAGYGFNKSHSAAYAMITYQTAYLKSHYPSEFMAAQLTCDTGNPDKITSYISECHNMGLKILPPHVNASFQTFHVSDSKIVFGLGAVKNVGENAVNSILEARKEGGAFCSIHDFARRVDLRKVNKKVLESLIKCGAFDGMGPNRRSMLDALDSTLEQASSFQREKSEGQFNLFSTECVAGASSNLTDIPIQSSPEWDDLLKLSYERELIGFYVTGHPLMNFESIIREFASSSTSRLVSVPASTLVRIAGMVKSIKEINTRKGDRMAFVTFEDLEGVVEVTVFSDLYALTRDLFNCGEPLMLSGLREGEADSPKILAQEIHLLKDAPRHFSRSVVVRMSTLGSDSGQIRSLKTILLRHRGKVPVKLAITIPNRSETIISLGSVGCDPSEAFLSELRKQFGYDPVATA